MHPRVFSLGQVTAALCAFVGSSFAQTMTQIVVPAAYENVEANGTVFWVASPFEARRQLLIGPPHLKGQVGQKLVSVAFRRNTGLNDNLDAGQLWIELWLSNGTVSTLRPAMSFQANRGKDHQRLFNRRVNFPATPASSISPAPWRAPHAVSLNLQAPFVYSGGTLVLESITRLQNPNTKQFVAPPFWTMDAQLDDPPGRVAPFGTSCIRNPDQTAGADAGSLSSGGTAVFFLHGGTRQGPVLLTVGTRPLAIDLSGFGFPGCHLYNDWLLLLQTVLQPMPYGWHAQAHAALPLPADNGLIGASLYTQWLAIHLGQAGPWLSFSNGVKSTLGGPQDSGMTWVESSDPDAGYGRIMFGRIPVLQLTFVKD